MALRRRIFTGLQPSGQLHIGNYFGALAPFLSLYKRYTSYLCVVDYHAMTTLRDPKALHQNILDVTRDYLAVGIDPASAVMFKQSDVSEHTELAWILECLVTVPFLMQAHAYKDKVAKGLEANAGLFNYPMLMAADILLYDTDVVPVGADQRQHIEYAREAASKFNAAFGATFKEPSAHIMEGVATVPGTDGRKMSKSYKNTIPLFATKEEIVEKVMGIITDSQGERPENVYAMHVLVRDQKQVDALYAENKGKYKLLKELLVEDLEHFIAPLRERRESFTDVAVKKILKAGARQAKEVASAKMKTVRTTLGVTL